jgi:hypothetical protein
MLDRSHALRALPFLALLGVAVASCSGGTSTTGGYYGGTGTSTNVPATLVSRCDTICSNVIANCLPATSLLGTCLDACNELNLLPLGCLDPFLSYLTCLAGSTQVQCGTDGTYVLITPPECQQARVDTLNCNASPGVVSACVALPGTSSCGTPGVVGSGPSFCVGAPEGCNSPSPNPLGIGVYCCPGLGGPAIRSIP